MTEKTKIILTGRPPIMIRKSEWPRIAFAKEYSGRDSYSSFSDWVLVVRRRQDGRTLVYGKFDTVVQGEYNLAGGELLEKGGDVVGAIRSVGRKIEAPDSLMDACIADLPADEI
jgi:hypothetical protein